MNNRLINNQVKETIFSIERIVIKEPLYKDDSLDAIRFPVRVLNTLIINGYITVGQFYFTPMDKLQKLRNVGPKSLEYFLKIKKAIKENHNLISSDPLKVAEKPESIRETQIRYTPYLSEIDKERMKLVKQLYNEYGTLDKVGSLLRISRERVRQILNKGQSYGLFDYQLTRDKKFDEILNRVDRDQLKELICTTKNQFDICSKLKIDINTLQRLIKCHNIDVQSYKQDIRYRRYLTEYSEIVKMLGYHPSTTLLQNNKKWRKTAVGIDRLWGGFDKFRSEFGIEKPKRFMHPNTLAAWNIAKQKRTAQKKENIESVYEIVKNLGPISCKKISDLTGLHTQNTNLYLNGMIDSKRIKRVGRGIRVKYKIA